MSDKVVNHKDATEIIKRLSDGDSVRKTAQWLKNKYPNDKTKWISSVTLQNFRKKNLQLEGKVLKDIQEAGSEQRRQIDEQQRQAKLKKNSAYKAKINQIADTHLDVATKILQLDAIIDDRMEYWYNAVGNGDANPFQADKELRQFMDRQMLLLQQYKKLVEGMADKTIAHNVNVTVMNEQIGVLRDVVREVMSEFSPELAILFVEKLNRKLELVEYNPAAPEKIDTNILGAVEAEIVSGDDDE